MSKTAHYRPKHYYGMNTRVNNTRRLLKKYKSKRQEAAALITRTIRRIEKTRRDYKRGGMSKKQYEKEMRLHKKTLANLRARFYYYDRRVKLLEKKVK